MTVELPILSLTIWLPILGAVLTLVSGDRAPRLTKWIALGFAVATFVASLPLYSWFQLGTAEMQFVERASWIPAFDVHYHLGVDGISMPLILLTTFMTVLVIIAGWEVIQYRPSQYMAAFLVMEGVMVGVFSALDAVLFYVFWEAMLIPMYFLIGIWGHERRIYAAVKFFLYTFAGSVLMRRVSESLAGRASYLSLWPMTRREQLGSGRCGIWDDLLATADAQWLDVVSAQPDQAEDWRSLARRGGFPTPAVHLTSDAERSIWFDGYVRTYLERDLQDLSAIAALPDYRRLMRAACLRLGQTTNQTELGRDVALPQPTVHRYLNLLETSYLLVRVPAYAVNRTKRLIKTPRLYWGDTGVALHLAGNAAPAGAQSLPAYRPTRRGGGGSNAVSRMISSKVGGVEFIAVNTDAQALFHSPASLKIPLATLFSM